jgi:hypothetical protein
MNFKDWLVKKDLDERFYRTWAKTMMEYKSEETVGITPKELYRLPINEFEVVRFLKTGIIHYIKVDNTGISELSWYKDGELIQIIRPYVGKYRIVKNYYTTSSLKEVYFLKKKWEKWEKIGERILFSLTGRVVTAGFHTDSSFIEYAPVDVNPLSRKSLMKSHPQELFFENVSVIYNDFNISEKDIMDI